MQSTIKHFKISALALLLACFAFAACGDDEKGDGWRITMIKGDGVTQEQFDTAVEIFKEGWKAFYAPLTAAQKAEADKITSWTIDTEPGFSATDRRGNWAVPAAAAYTALLSSWMNGLGI